MKSRRDEKNSPPFFFLLNSQKIKARMKFIMSDPSMNLFEIEKIALIKIRSNVTVANSFNTSQLAAKLHINPRCVGCRGNHFFKDCTLKATPQDSESPI